MVRPVRYVAGLFAAVALAAAVVAVVTDATATETCRPWRARCSSWWASGHPRASDCVPAVAPAPGARCVGAAGRRRSRSRSYWPPTAWRGRSCATTRTRLRERGRCCWRRSGWCCRVAARAHVLVSDRRAAVQRWRPAGVVAAVSCGGAMLLLLGQNPLEGPYGPVANPLGGQPRRSRAGRRSSGSCGAECCSHCSAGVARAAGPLPGGRPGGAPADPVARVRSAAAAAVARRHVARGAHRVRRERLRSAGDRPRPCLARDRPSRWR